MSGFRDGNLAMDWLSACPWMKLRDYRSKRGAVPLFMPPLKCLTYMPIAILPSLISVLRQISCLPARNTGMQQHIIQQILNRSGITGRALRGL